MQLSNRTALNVSVLAYSRVSSSDVIVTAATTYTTMAGMSLVSTATGTYRIAFNGFMKNNLHGTSYVGLFINTTRKIQTIVVDNPDAGEAGGNAPLYDIVSMVSGDTLKVQWYVSAGTSTQYGTSSDRILTYIKL